MMKLFEANKMMLEENGTNLVKCLEKVGVTAKLVENGILFDSEAFKNIKWWEAPHLLFMNRKWFERA